MTSESNLMGGFCRLYSVLLHAYPPEFRRPRLRRPAPHHGLGESLRPLVRRPQTRQA
jgi:hypothetical protein